MRLILTTESLPRLEDPSDFRRFSVAIAPELQNTLDKAVAPIGSLASPEHIWVRPDAIRALSPLAGDIKWAENFDAMLTYAQSKGWAGPEGAIRAHIEILERPPAVDVAAFRNAMRRFASGVCVVATGHQDNRCGMTISAFTSVSAEPPLVLICLNRSARAHAAIVGADRFSINILGASQEEIAMTFAGQRGLYGAERFDQNWQDDQQTPPILTTALHSIICTKEDLHNSGSHSVLVGRVVASHAGNPNDQALLNYDGALRKADWAA